MSDIICNLCGGTKFAEFRTRGRIRCVKCQSIERTRVAWMFIEKYAELRPGMRVLHFAPERALSHRIHAIVGDGYECKDLDPDRYAKAAMKPERFNLCKDLEALPSDRYDLVLHNHVLEHLPCNITAVLWHLHRALHPDGLHMFSVPIFSGCYEECLDPLDADEANRRFHQADHVRNFGRNGLAATLGMVFDIDAQIGQGLKDHFPEELLRKHCVPATRWKRFNGASLFVLPKDALRLH